MKRNLLLTLLGLMICAIAIAQTTKNKRMDKILGNKAFQEAANASMTYNQNVNANLYLTDLSERWIMGVNEFEKYESKLVKTGHKDPAGNEILHIHFFKGGVLTYVLVPDFEDCPMFYLLYGVSNELIHARASSGMTYSDTKKVRVANRMRVYQLTPTNGPNILQDWRWWRHIGRNLVP